MDIEAFKKLRKQRNLKQTDLASAIGVSTSAIGMYEQGRREPDHETLLKLANYFNVSADYLLGNPVPELDSKELADQVLQSLTSEKALKFNAQNFTEEDYEKMSAAIQSAAEAIIRKNRQID